MSVPTHSLSRFPSLPYLGTHALLCGLPEAELAFHGCLPLRGLRRPALGHLRVLLRQLRRKRLSIPLRYHAAGEKEEDEEDSGVTAEGLAHGQNAFYPLPHSLPPPPILARLSTRAPGPKHPVSSTFLTLPSSKRTAGGTARPLGDGTLGRSSGARPSRSGPRPWSPSTCRTPRCRQAPSS